MPASPTGFTVEFHFIGKSPAVREIYNRLMKALRKLGSVTEEPKKPSIHLVHGSALAGVSRRKDAPWLNLRLDHKIASPRINKVEQVTAKHPEQSEWDTGRSAKNSGCNGREGVQPLPPFGDLRRGASQGRTAMFLFQGLQGLIVYRLAHY